MTIPFVCVAIAFAFIFLSKVPVGIAMARQSGGYDNNHPRDQQAKLVGWGRRATAAHVNTIEAFPGFAAGTIIAHLLSADPTWTARLAVTFVMVRVLYVVFYIRDIHWARTAVWSIGFGSTIALFLLPLFKG